MLAKTRAMTEVIVEQRMRKTKLQAIISMANLVLRAPALRPASAGSTVMTGSVGAITRVLQRCSSRPAMIVTRRVSSNQRER